MRIHADNLDSALVLAAARESDMIVESFSEHGSKSRKKAFNILCSGNSTRNAMSNSFKAATWDQWGVFLGILFDADETMTVPGVYADSDCFYDQTFNRFVSGARPNIDVKSSHTHRWINSGSPRLSECKSDFCTAQMHWVI